MLLRSAFDLLSDVERSLALPSQHRHLLTDVVVDESALAVTVDVPGVDDDEITVECHGDVLTVTVERAASEVRGRVLAAGRMPVSGSVSMRLDRRFDTDSVEARLDRGVLHVTVPVRSGADPSTRRVPILTTSPERAAVTSAST